MKIYTCQQKSAEWHALRLGSITATSFATMANGRKETIETLCLKKASEIITGESSETFYTNEAMEHGIELEDEAREMYESWSFQKVDQVGFVEMNDFIGCSPDGLVGDNGGVEIKAPQPHTHMKYLIAASPHKAYKWQCEGFLFVTQRKWVDFVSYCPAYPPSKRLLIDRVFPDKDCFAKLRDGMEYCIGRIKEILKCAK